MGWKEVLKSKASEALAKVEETAMQEARVLLSQLTSAGVHVMLDGKSNLKVTGKLDDVQRANIRRLKSELLSILSPLPTSWWQADDLAIRVSLSPSAIVDFVIGPVIEGLGTPLLPEACEAFLANASPSWREKVKRCGGLAAYSLSQWEAVKPKLQQKLEGELSF